MNLFQLGNFVLASGKTSDFKIECDALTDDDWETLAYLIHLKAVPFSSVIGIPRGGEKLAEHLKKYITHTSSIRLLVDDVYSTGKSLGQYRKRHDEVWVVFARKKPTNGIRALFVMEN